MDLAAPYGEMVYAAGNGRVVSAGYSRSYGWFVRICHEGGYSTLYAHMSRILVRKGGTVRIGQRIGLVGSTGAATGNHLHFELQKNGRLLDPIKWFGRLF
ncbi:peptidase, M23 family [Bacteroides sp. 3_1_33FAA]|nr:peptidase, M23 family [Bacteroides sp. 3_1_33FAA]